MKGFMPEYYTVRRKVNGRNKREYFATEKEAVTRANQCSLEPVLKGKSSASWSNPSGSVKVLSSKSLDKLRVIARKPKFSRVYGALAKVWGVSREQAKQCLEIENDFRRACVLAICRGSEAQQAAEKPEAENA